jgi:hypothetical protein
MKNNIELGKHFVQVMIDDFCGDPTEILLGDDIYELIGELTTTILSSRNVKIDKISIFHLATSNIIEGLLNGNVTKYETLWEPMDELKTLDVMIYDIMNTVECQN